MKIISKRTQNHLHLTIPSPCREGPQTHHCSQSFRSIGIDHRRYSEKSEELGVRVASMPRNSVSTYFIPLNHVIIDDFYNKNLHLFVVWQKIKLYDKYITLHRVTRVVTLCLTFWRTFHQYRNKFESIVYYVMSTFKILLE